MPVTRRVADDDSENQLPSEVVDVGSRMQQLADVPTRVETADALTGTMDQLAHSANRSSSDTDSTGVAQSERLAHAESSEGLVDVPKMPSPALTGEAALALLAEIAQHARPRLGDGQSLPEPYRLRSAEQRAAVARQLGGNERTQVAVDAALAWLAAQQETDGRWDADRWASGVETRVAGHDRQGAGTHADTGITGLALLAFLASGQTHLDGTYRTNVQHGLEFLLRSQASDGNLAGDARFFAACTVTAWRPWR